MYFPHVYPIYTKFGIEVSVLGIIFVDCCKKMNQSRKRFLLTVNFSCSSIIFSQTISVLDNRIHKIDDGAFYGLNKLHTLKLVRCRLRLMPPVTDVKGTLRSLNLRRNLITFIPFGYFQGFVKLEALFIDQNRMVRFPDVRQLNQTLYMLYLSFNRIPVIPRNIISSCVHLKYLKMSMNMLQTLKRSFFDGKTQLWRYLCLGIPGGVTQPWLGCVTLTSGTLFTMVCLNNFQCLVVHAFQTTLNWGVHSRIYMQEWRYLSSVSWWKLSIMWTSQKV